MWTGSNQLRGLDPEFAERLIYALYYANEEGISGRLISGFRSLAVQRRLYADYVAGKTRLPVAPPGKSMHNFGLAMDLVASNLPRFVEIAQYFGVCWLGEYDPVHFSINCR